MARLDEDISRRISILRYLMIFGIIMLHTPPYVPLADTGPGVFDFIKASFQHAIFRASVPVLTFVSGFLLFRSRMDLRPRQLFVKKTRTILIPLVLFNVPVAVAIYLIQAGHLLDHQFSQQLYPFDPETWLSAITGLFSAPVNYPLNFLRDLYILSLLAPLMGLLLRLAWVGLGIVFTVFWFNYDGALILRNTMPIVFYLGGMAATQAWDLRRLDRLAAPLLLLFLALCAAIVLLKIENRDYLRLVSPFLIWPAASLLVHNRFGLWLASLSKYSFLTFLAHSPLVLIAYLVYTKLLPEWPYWLYWVATPVISAIILAQVYIYSQRYVPKTMNLLLGGR